MTVPHSSAFYAHVGVVIRYRGYAAILQYLCIDLLCVTVTVSLTHADSQYITETLTHSSAWQEHCLAM